MVLQCGEEEEEEVKSMFLEVFFCRTSNGLPHGTCGTAEVFGTEPCCLNTYSPLPLRLLLCLSKQSVLPAVFSGSLQNIHRQLKYYCFKT